MPDGTMSPDRFDEFRELHAQGLGRNTIAREMNIARACITRTATHLGLDFDRSKTAEATTARLADLAERRALLAEDLIGDAEKLRAEVWEPRTYWDWGGKDHDYDERVHDTTPGDKRALMGAAGMAIDRSLKLAPSEESSGLEAGKSMLGQIGEALVAFTRAEDERETQHAEGDGA